MNFIIHGELQFYVQKVQNIENVEVEAKEKSLKNKVTSLVETKLFSNIWIQLKKKKTLKIVKMQRSPTKYICILT